MKLIIDIPEDVYKRTKFYKEFRDLNDCVITIKALENSAPLSKWVDGLTDKVNEAFAKSNHTREYMIEIIKEYYDE